MLKTHLLAYGLTHLTDARYFAAWHADYLCFPIGEGGISIDEFLAIREWVEGPVCVAELDADAGAGFIEELAQRGITHFLVDHGVPLATGREGVDVITRIPVAGYQSAEDIREQIAEAGRTIVLDFTSGGITWADLQDGYPFRPEDLGAALSDREAFLRTEMTEGEAVAAAKAIHGLAIRGSSEEKVGYKSFDDIDDLLDVLAL